MARKKDVARKTRRASKRLPESFVSDNTRQPERIYPPGWEEAVKLFAEIAEQRGLEEADRIYTEVLKRARRAAVKLPSYRPVRRKSGSHDPQRDLDWAFRKSGSHNIERDLEWVSLYFQALREGMTQTEAIAHVFNTALHKPAGTLAALERHLRRLMAPDRPRFVRVSTK